MSEIFRNSAKTFIMFTKGQFINFVQKNRIFSTIYSFWFIINFSMLLISDKLSAELFYPFGKSAELSIYTVDGRFSDSVFHTYDITEFIFYCSLPFIILFIYKNIIKTK